MCWNNWASTELVVATCAGGVEQKQADLFHMHLRVLLGLVGVMDQ